MLRSSNRDTVTTWSYSPPLKLKISVRQVYRRYGATIQTDDSPRRVLRVEVQREGKPPLMAQWGAISLSWRAAASIRDAAPPRWVPRTDLLDRLMAETCELCGSQENVTGPSHRRRCHLPMRSRQCSRPRLLALTPGSAAQSAGTETATAVNGLSLTLSVPETVYPWNALARARLSIRTLTSRPVSLSQSCTWFGSVEDALREQV